MRHPNNSMLYLNEIVICCAAIVTIYSVLLPCFALFSITFGKHIARFDLIHQLVLLFIVLLGLLPIATGVFEHRDRNLTYVGAAGWLCLLLSVPSSGSCCGIFIACAAGEVSVAEIRLQDWLHQLLPIIGGALLLVALTRGTQLRRRMAVKRGLKSRRFKNH